MSEFVTLHLCCLFYPHVFIVGDSDIDKMDL